MHLLDCGFRLPASTGSDWFVCSSNRVYVETGSPLSYETWLARLQEGRTFVTNGPALRLTVAGHAPSTAVLDMSDALTSAPVVVEWAAAQPVDRIEIIRDGEVVSAHELAAETTAGVVTTKLDVSEAGWVAAVIGKTGGTLEFSQNCTPGYYNDEGHPTETSRQNGFYMGGPTEFAEILERWRADGRLEGLEVA